MRSARHFLLEQHIAAVTGADRNDRVVLRKMADEPALRIHIEQRMEAAIAIAFARGPGARTATLPMRVMMRMLSTT